MKTLRDWEAGLQGEAGKANFVGFDPEQLTGEDLMIWEVANANSDFDFSKFNQYRDSVVNENNYSRRMFVAFLSQQLSAVRVAQERQLEKYRRQDPDPQLS